MEVGGVHGWVTQGPRRLERRALFLVVAAVLTAVGCSDRDRLEGRPSAGPESSAALQTPDSAEAARLRKAMVERQLRSRDISDTAVLRVLGQVPRHRFIPGASMELSYADHPVPIGHGQTISQPYIVAFMAQAADLDSGDRVLEIGAGSGYGAAVLAGLADRVYTIEIVPELAERARTLLDELGYDDVHVRTGNGWLGWPEHAPYDAVVVTAAPDEVPEALAEQLAEGGTMVIPVGEAWQELRVLTKEGGRLRQLRSLPVRFVPMVGKPRDTAG